MTASAQGTIPQAKAAHLDFQISHKQKAIYDFHYLPWFGSTKSPFKHFKYHSSNVDIEARFSKYPTLEPNHPWRVQWQRRNKCSAVSGCEWQKQHKGELTTFLRYKFHIEGTALENTFHRKLRIFGGAGIFQIFLQTSWLNKCDEDGRFEEILPYYVMDFSRLFRYPNSKIAKEVIYKRVMANLIIN